MGVSDNFETFIDRWGLINGPLKGAKFTWSSFQQCTILSRLDWFLFCGEWKDLFSNHCQSVLSRTTSNHSLICLGSCRPARGPCPFKFEMWFL